MIQVFCVNTTEFHPNAYHQLYSMATADRKRRADRYLRKEDSLRCVTADALLRLALGTASYETETDAGGKPRIRGRADFQYNLSHSGSWVVLACGGTPLGIDVEAYREDVNLSLFLPRYFTPREAEYCLAAANPYRNFFQVWTGKESYLKYLGTGLRKDLRSFDIFCPEDGVVIRHQILPDGSSLSLCAPEQPYSVTFISPEKLLQPAAAAESCKIPPTVL